MPYDPSYPATNALIESEPMREQFIGLKNLIDAVPVVTGVQVVAVNTLPPGDPAQATVGLAGGVVEFTFGLPAGESGPPGEVSGAQLATAIQGTALNPSGVQPLGMNFSDPVSASDLNTVKDKLNDLIAALFRSP